MKLHFISAHEKVGPMRKSFGLLGGASRSYPLAGKITSYEEELDLGTQGLKEYRQVLVNHAAAGHALMKGNLKRPLVNESRRGQADKEGKTHLLILDIDGVTIDGFKAGAANESDVRRAAELVVAMLPTELHHVSYVAVGSSSFGLKDNVVSVHLHFLLTDAIDHRIMKIWLRGLNYTQESIYAKLELTPAKLAVKSIVDPCLAEASRIVYISPPFFGPEANNPFTSDELRVVQIDKQLHTLDMKPLIAKMNLQTALIEQRKSEKLKTLQRAVGISTSQKKFSKVRTSKGTQSVVQNPETIVMTLAYEADTFVAYNVGAGDSNAYIVQKNNPEVVTSFKPDEPSFSFSKADPQAYAMHIEKFGEQFTEVVNEETGVTQRVKRLMFTDRLTDSCNTLEYDADSGEIIELVTQAPSTAAEYMRFHGQIVPDPVPPYYLVNDPTRTDTFYMEGDKPHINQFVPTKYMSTTTENPFPNARYGLAWQICVECPLIAELVLHMLGDDMDAFEHFINWFAYIFQSKEKAKTAWLLQGTQGTGKGLFYHAVVRPIFGEKYSKQALLQVIADDQFNGWMENCLFLMIDEFDMKATGSMKRTASMLKNAITEPTMMVRHMQQAARDTKQNINFLMGTNEFDALAMDDKRRFNVAPRQQRMLNTRTRMMNLLSFKEEYNELIADELDVFCAFLRDFKVNNGHVSTVMESDAREEAIKMGRNSAERFFHNVYEGDFGAFVEILDKQDNSVPERDLPQLRRVKDFLRANLEHVNTGRACYLHRDDLRSIYSMIAGKQISDNAFGRMIGQHDFIIKREARPVGSLVALATRPRCVEVHWNYSDLEALQMLQANNVPLANVTPIQQNAPAQSDGELERRMAEANALLSNEESW